MENTQLSGAPKSRLDFPLIVKWVLSSSFAAAVVALFATLLGLLFRMGWLSAFQISSDLFMPNTTTELTYWGYVAALVIWGDIATGLLNKYWWLLLIASIYGAGTFAFVLVAKWLEGSSDQIRFKTEKIIQRTGIRASIATVVVFSAMALIPIFFISATAVIVGLPFIGYSAGQRVAKTSISTYRNSLKNGHARCNELRNSSGVIGKCPMVIAQASGRIAYLDGDFVHVLPAEGITVNWELPSDTQKAIDSKLP